MLRIRIGQLTILGQRNPLLRLQSGLFVAPDGLDGWDDSAPARRDATPRPVAHGEFDAVTYQGARVVSIDGFAIADSEQELAHLRSQVTGIAADGTARIVVDHQGQTLWADARRADTTKFKDLGARAGALCASFFVQLVCVDPRKYGELRSFNGPTATCLHYGNFPALPVIEVTGTLPTGYTVASQGKQFIVSQALAAGQTHRIDMRRGWLYRDDVLQSGAVAQADTFTIPVGAATPVVFTPASGTGAMTVSVTDTFI